MQILRVCTWNIKFGDNLEKILEELKSHEDFKDLDVLALEEASVHDGVEDAQVIAQALGEAYDFFQVPFHRVKGKIQGNALIWNTKTATISKKDSFKLPNRKISGFNRMERAFLRLIPSQNRGGVVGGGTFHKIPIRIYVTHLDVMGFSFKRLQLKALFERERKSPFSTITLVMGDLNTFKLKKYPTWNNLASEAHRYGFTDLTSQIQASFYHPMIRSQKLDAIFIKPEIVNYKSWTLPLKGSDHLPLFANINLL